jgi:hypothetical protein
MDNPLSIILFHAAAPAGQGEQMYPPCTCARLFLLGKSPKNYYRKII